MKIKYKERDFKFRAWNKELKIMEMFDSHKRGILYAYGKFEVNSGWDSYDRLTFEESTSNKYIIMQYTELNDANYEEIYEGDIVEDMTSKRYIVMWNKINAQFYLSEIKTEVSSPFSDYFDFDSSCCEDEYDLVVIGNIYESPELLKENRNGN